MATNIEEQQTVLLKVREILSTYHTRDAVRGELASLGFVVKAEHGNVVSMESAPAEIFVQLSVNDQDEIVDSHVVTFEEIELKPEKKD
ncbi:MULTISPECIES: hypothetical protein [unclassified Methanoculleus]|uniref:hypothetical protein n=1 Tax=unclassified Methanoculleus TaxID=2619537 RepID=UPI0025DA5F79|nr:MULTISPECIES: hypothetical protein [unclassified Methanoculleus]MCK9317116.1 hypothetical protein [Methanoculleus sp.]MDD2253394.1 hypothetical protein [Methanoculleus sp.]MDD2788625.1 hypothetical protein [Methanoculleus sp.]MDD3215027.1 hypothetical protein [Methanoculleus sp.]MDD4314001.1 hypothetical protein [Methanoculleus sp.]